MNRKFICEKDQNLINLIAWKNDKVWAKIIVPNADAICKVNVDFPVCNNEAIENITLYAEQKVMAYTGHAGWYADNKGQIMPKGKRQEVGEWLKKLEKDYIRNSDALWIEIDVPTQISSGDYCGNITVGEKVVALNIKVLELVMPSTSDYKFNVEYWNYPYSVAEYYNVTPFSDKHLEIMEKQQAFYAKLGGKAMTATIVEEAWNGQTYSKGDVHYPSMVKWTKKLDGSFSFDYSDFDKWVELNLSVGVNKKICCYSLMIWGGKLSYYDEKSGKQKKSMYPIFMWKRYTRVWTQFLNDFVKHLDEKGWFDLVYMSYDERHNMEKVLNFVSSFKNKDGHNFSVSAAFNGFISNKKCFDLLDYASVTLEEVKKNEEVFSQIAQDRTLQGKETSIYTATESFPNSVSLSQPIESYWTILYALAQNTNGYLRWAFDAWVEAPLKDTTHWSFPAGDCFLVFPQEKDSKVFDPQWSLRLVNLDQGVREANKLLYIKANYSQKVAEIDNIIAKIHSEYECNYITDKANGIWTKTAKWITNESKEKLNQDMEDIKTQIDNLYLGL